MQSATSNRMKIWPGRQGGAASVATCAAPRKAFCPFLIPWFLVVALEIAIMAPLRIAESDIWFHLRNAAELLQQHSFLRADLYTFTSRGSPLIDHEWLAELPYYAAYSAWGLRGVLAVYLVVLWLIFLAVYSLACRRGADYGDAAIVTMAGVALAAYSFGPRMHQFGWLCMALLLLILDRFDRSGRGLWLLPPLFALWVNLHGSWLFGLLVMGIYGVAGLIEGRWGSVVSESWSRGKLEKFAGVVALSVLALFANPYGTKLVLYPMDLMFRQQANLAHVVEWQSVDFHTLPGKMALLMIFGVVSAAWFSQQRWRLVDVLLIAFALFVSLLHVRLLIFAALLLVPILAPRLHLFPPYNPVEDRPWLNLVLSLGIAVLIIAVFPRAAVLRERVESQFPGKALAFMKQGRMSGHLFHYYDFGGYIEWNQPAVETFADGRTDIFVYNGVFEDYLGINALQNPLALLDKYRIDHVLFPPDKPLSYLLDRSPGWRKVYQDKVANVYERTPSLSSARLLRRE